MKSCEIFCMILMLSAPLALGFGVNDLNGLNAGSRWDTTPRTMGGQERSLSGGLRFSLQGGSYTAYRNLLTWSGTPPTAAAFEQAVLEAFAFWTSTDPATGLGTTLSFVADLATPVSTTLSGSVRLGAEIDIMVATDATSWNPGDAGTQAETFFNSISVAGNLKLTSGTTGYPGFAISGADVTFNNNPQAIYTLSTFRTILTHEIGHALGLNDVDVNSGPSGNYLDDNYSSTNALATLTNSFALKINHLNPALSPLTKYTVANGTPGVDTPGVDILMESNIPTAFFGTGAGLKLANDDYAGRQFLYPVAPTLPKLTITRSATEIILRWPDLSAWTLETSTSLAAASWSPTASQGTLVSGQRELHLPISGRRFFRLKG